ncbi:MAG: hypothetical protein JST75_03395 [Bacteroidetes bacterium]|nr:hypothetical protein [Bacteroidota bacterium]
MNKFIQAIKDLNLSLLSEMLHDSKWIEVRRRWEKCTPLFMWGKYI